ncbi:MAG: hypothetical protein ACE5F5_09005 [Acidimicrobiia bacterium]
MTPDTEHQENKDLGLSGTYLLFIGFLAGAFITIALAIAVLIVT